MRGAMSGGKPAKNPDRNMSSRAAKWRRFERLRRPPIPK